MEAQSKPNGIFLLNASAYSEIYDQETCRAISELITVIAPPQTAETLRDQPNMLSDVEVILSGWGMPVVDADFLAHAPRLEAIFYGAGSVRGFTTEAMWKRGVRVTSAQAGNAVPVADYTLAVILFALKHGWQLASKARAEQRFPSSDTVPGIYGATVGIVSLGLIGQLVCQRLRSFDVRVLAYDPLVPTEEVDRLGVKLCSLEEIFATAQVVSLHAPLLPETAGLVSGEHLMRLPAGATFINTSRGGVVRQDEMIAVLQRRPDLYAVLDVTTPEPPPPGSPLYVLPNVTLTPHIAGAVGGERRRLGHMMLDELRRYVSGQPLRYELRRAQVEHMATP